MSPDVADHVARQRDEYRDHDYEMWLDERDRQMDMAEECAQDRYEESRAE